VSHIINRDFMAEIKKGTIPGHSCVHKFGRNNAVPNGSWAFVNLLGFTGWPLSAATTVRIKAGGNAADTSGGAGAVLVTVQGIDSALAETSEAITTAGASASTATTASFWRVHRAWVGDTAGADGAGTYGASNTAAVTIENSGGGTDLLQIAIEEGQSQFAGWTVPTGKTAYLMSLHLHADTNKTANFRVMTRASMNDTTPPVAAVRLKLFFDGVEGSIVYKPRIPELKLSALTDIWVEAYGDGATAHCSADFELMLVDD